MRLFVIPIHQSSASYLHVLQPLLTHTSQWPLWLKDKHQWCLGVLPIWLLISHQDTLICLERQADCSYQETTIVNDDFLLALKTKFSHTPCPAYPLDDSFTGGLMGWMSYPESSQQHQHETIAFPARCFGFYDVFIRPHADGQCYLYAPNQEIVNTILGQLHTVTTACAFKLDDAFMPLMSQQHYQQAFDKVHTYLQSGDCYQVNLAQAFKAECTGSSIAAFKPLLALSQAPYAAYVSCIYGDILSLSPELFLQFEGDATVLTRPIKGTRPRHSDGAEDLAQRNDLASHPKDHAENVMIVDLLRHDLGKHAVIGSVKVPKLFSVESFPQVHHLISDVTCQLKEGSSPLDLLFDAFPGGSITGAPKKRAMEIIAELENCQRAIYCGTIGYLTKEGRGQWNIAIRTLLRIENAIYAWAGGGIVADSICESEYQECFNKIGAILRTLEKGS